MRCIAFILLSQMAAVVVARAGDDPRVKCLGIEQGLSNNAVTCVYQDARGFMWFGTYDGLNRYDGYGFTVYRTMIGDSNSIPFDNVATIAGDSQHDLWVGGQKGIGIFDPVTARFSVPWYIPCNGGKSVGVRQPVQVRQQVHILRPVGADLMLVGMHSNGLLVFAGGSRVGEQIAMQGEARYDVPCISYDSISRRVWLFVQKKGLYRLDLRSRQL